MRSRLLLLTGLVCALLLAAASARPPAAAAVNTTAPPSPVKLVFIHHSTGEAWLSDGHGRLGLELRDNNYFVSDTNYGWGPAASATAPTSATGGPGSADPRRPPTSPRCTPRATGTAATRDSRPTPAARTRSCCSRAASPTPSWAPRTHPSRTIADNPLKGQSVGGGDFTVANAKGIYRDLLPYFGAHTDKLFVAVVAPPVTSPATPGGRALANWLTDHWLQDSGYTAGNVLVFDFYTVLSSKTGDGASDVGSARGNHHRVWNGAVQHKTDDGADRLAYPSAGGDSHPNAAGDQKATAEFVPLLNAAYNAWQGNGGGDTTGPRTFAPRRAVAKKGQRAALSYRVTDDLSAKATVTIRIRTRGGALKKTLTLGLRGTGAVRQCHFTCKLARGVYRFTVEARDLSGNAAQKPLGSNRLTVR